MNVATKWKCSDMEQMNRKAILPFVLKIITFITSDFYIHSAQLLYARHVQKYIYSCRWIT